MLKRSRELSGGVSLSCSANGCFAYMSLIKWLVVASCGSLRPASLASSGFANSCSGGRVSGLFSRPFLRFLKNW